MGKIITLLFIIVLVIVGYVFGIGKNKDTTMDQKAENTISTESVVEGLSVIPVTHATAVLEWGNIIIYTDPTGGREAFAGQKAPDIILVTDIHGDHLNAETLEAVIGETTVLIAPQAVVDELPEALAARAVVLANGETSEQKNIAIEAVPMYNLPDQGVEIRHEKGRGNGYVLTQGETRVYIAGDTADIPEMRALTGIDVALVPMNMPFTMDVERAASAVIEFAPRQVYPYHYRGRDGLADVGKFKELVNAGNAAIDVILAEWYPGE